MSGPGVSARESVLLSLFLTFLSVMASWLASRYYADYSFNKNLRTFALKAAEKVDNLSQELDRLTAYLQQEIETTDSGLTPAEALRLKDARIESAIHIIGTLKSVNDRSLSDWQGVIGDELDAQKKRRQQQEADLRDLVQRLETLYSERAPGSAMGGDGPRSAALEQEVEALKQDLGVLVSQVSGVSVRRAKSTKARRETIQNDCPQCLHPVEYRQRPIPNSIVNVGCGQCDANLYSRYENGEFYLRLRDPIAETIACPSCGKANRLDLDPVPGGAPTEARCRKCGVLLRASRTAGGVSVKWVGPAQTLPATVAPPIVPELTEAILQQVQAALPPQPKGTTRQVAEQTRLPLALVNEAVDRLIQRGVFRAQENGVLVSPPSRISVAVPEQEPLTVMVGVGKPR